jgi:DNA-binding SARP family transcriptional activator
VHRRADETDGRDRLRLRCFGVLEIARPDGSDVGPIFQLPRRGALFLYLALREPPDPVPRGELAAMFWPFLASGPALYELDRALFALRQVLGDVWVARDDAVGVARDGLWCDVWAFREALAAGDFDRAAALYRGPLLERPGLFGAGAFQLWVEQERVRLRQAALAAFAELGARAARAGDWRAAAERFREAARAEPLAEDNLRCLMVALANAGDRTAALRAYELLRRRLKLRHGRDPDRETVALAHVIHEGATPPLEPFLPI